MYPMIHLHLSRKPQNSVVIKNDIIKIISKNKNDLPEDFEQFIAKVEGLLSYFPEYRSEWRNRTVFRMVKTETLNQSHVEIYYENISLPDVKHDLDLVLKMLNHIREKNNLEKVKMPLFVQPDELFLAYKQGRFDHEIRNIQSQLAVVFQNSSINYIGLVFGFRYVILEGS
jgi:hypothetical protein